MVIERPIRVLVVDDSQTLRRFVLRVLEASGRFHVCGLADSGRGAARAIERHAPDVVLLDMQMPVVDGLEATRAIMAERPTPVVLFCGISDAESQRRALTALEAGAVSIVPKPGPGQDLDSVVVELVRAIEVAAGVRTLTRHRAADARPVAAPRPPDRPRPPRGSSQRPIIAIGASTGGPPALRELLRGLAGRDTPPIVVVQHIVAGFLENLVSWLASEVPAPIAVGSEGALLEHGRIVFAPSQGHLVVVDGGRVAIDPGPPVQGHRPSVDVLFRSVAREAGPAAVGVLLTGMGEDGARGLGAMREAGADTFAQDEATSVVYGMPRAARELGAARQVLPVWALAAAITDSPSLRGEAVQRCPRRSS
jgi:two-component system chemotaxis response regulator CheB